MLSRDCRHRLGSTVGGACSAERKPYGSRLQTTLPCGDMILAFSTVPRKPRAASSKSLTSENGSAFSVAACCAMTEAEASFGDSLGVSVMAGWLIVVYSLRKQKIGTMLAKLQPLELAAVAPSVDIFEIGHRARGMADIELGRWARLTPFIVVVAGRAVG